MISRKASDAVLVREDGFARLRTRLGETIAGRKFLSDFDKPVVEVKGWVNAVLRERGKIVPGSHREGFNIWTNTGREYLAMVQALKNASATYRQDAVAYIGVGIGSQLEDANVQRLVTPIEFAPGVFLAPLDLPTFPLTPTRTTVRYARTFTESEITLTANSKVNISEIGLFTNGDPLQDNAWGTRDTSLANAGSQSPVSYKAIEPVSKTDALELEVSWEIRL